MQRLEAIVELDEMVMGDGGQRLAVHDLLKQQCW